MRAIRETVIHQYFFGPQQSPVPDYGRHVATWSDVEREVLDSLRDQAAAKNAP